ncbi:ABC transporter permease [Actinotalea sp. C106]|uniref:ABC transporter permease n=1 Tax=Actinotalea sp. C106 TaxID=2908644 RepID=UPI0020298CB8|nr:ABC transporter permease [Actinotalea sp. C106]
MSSPVWMVTKREFRTRMMTKSNIISLSIMLAVIVIGAVVGSFFLDRDTEGPSSSIAVEQGVTALQPHLEQAATEQGLALELSTLTTDEAEQALIAEEDPLDAHLSGDPSAPRMLVAETADPAVVEIVTSAVNEYVLAEQIGALGGDPADVGTALATAAPQVESLVAPEESEFDGPAFVVSVVMISLLLFALIGGGSMISMGVVEEKTSRVVELLLSTIKPTQLLAGKILGIGAYALFQIVVLGGALTLAVTALGLTEDIEVNVGAALGLLVVWFLLGYTIYALLFGGFAALVSRQEEIGSVTTPLMFLLFIPYYVTMFVVVNDPDSTLARVLTFIPFFAPFVVPVRDALGGLPMWELGVSIGLCLVTIPVLIWLSARVYQRGVLHTGGRMKLTEALKG